MRTLLVVALVAVAVACADDDRADSGDTVEIVDTGDVTAAVAPATTASVTTGPADRGDDSARAALDDVVAWLADPAAADPSRFAASFLAQISIEQVRDVLVSIGPGAWTVVDVDTPAPNAVVARLEGPGPPLVVSVSVDREGRIEGLLFEPAELADPPTTLAGLVERLQATAPIAGFLRADVTADGACAPVAELAPDDEVPIGSVFKLYVLGAVAAAIEAGAVAWDDPVELRDELDSLPSGTTQDEPAGSTLTVRELALRMISVSDNTATDHLMDLVGREAVEDALTALGHADPAATIPMPTTRELFVIKADPDLLARYEAADAAGRHALLDGEVAAAPLPAVAGLPTEPTAVTTVEWFASPADVCRALVGLDDLAARPGLAPIREVLAANPGVPVDADVERLLFKGGSEPGVVFTAWLATRPDGTRIVVAGGLADEAAPIDPTAPQLLALGLTLP